MPVTCSIMLKSKSKQDEVAVVEKMNSETDFFIDFGEILSHSCVIWPYSGSCYLKKWLFNMIKDIFLINIDTNLCIENVSTLSLM